MERWLIEALRAGGDNEGLIGKQAGKDVRTLPSAIYWSGLASYGIFLQPGITRAQYARACTDDAAPPTLTRMNLLIAQRRTGTAASLLRPKGFRFRDDRSPHDSGGVELAQ